MAAQMRCDDALLFLGGEQITVDVGLGPLRPDGTGSRNTQGVIATTLRLGRHSPRRWRHAAAKWRLRGGLA